MKDKLDPRLEGYMRGYEEAANRCLVLVANQGFWPDHPLMQAIRKERDETIERVRRVGVEQPYRLAFDTTNQPDPDVCPKACGFPMSDHWRQGAEGCPSLSATESDP